MVRERLFDLIMVTASRRSLDQQISSLESQFTGILFVFKI